MGYGLNTTKHSTRKWGKVITWRGESKGKLEAALDVWQEACGITFSKAGDSDAAVDFTVQWDAKICQWSNGSPGNGKPAANKAGVLILVAGETLGTMLHEIGHLLGLSHEQDHPDGRQWLVVNKVPFGVDGAKARAADNDTYGDYDPSSIMHYPAANYSPKSKPTAGDIAAVKKLNGW